MNVMQIPPDGTPAEFEVDVPVPSGVEYINGIQICFSFAEGIPAQFFPQATLDGQDIPLNEHARDVMSVSRLGMFAEESPSTVRLRVSVNEEGHLDPGNEVTIHAWGVQVLDNADSPVPATVNNPTALEDAVEVGLVQVVTWTEWYRLNGRDDS